MLACQKVSRSTGVPVQQEGLAADVLERSNDEVAVLVRQLRDGNPCVKTAARVRRSAAVAHQPLDLVPASQDSLPEYLCRQLGMSTHQPRMAALARWIIWNLEPDGYLREDLAALGTIAEATAAEMEQALGIVQSLEPIGVGARSLRECLLLQLRAQLDPDEVAIELVHGHLKPLSEKRYEELARRLRQTPERIVRAVAAIRRLEPRPGRAFGDEPVQTVRPEVTIERCGDDHRVVLCDDDVPRVEMSRRRWADAAGARGENRKLLTDRLRTASGVITALEHRRETVRQIAETIVRRQREFLMHGPVRLRPLSIREVAAEIGVHDSTVSRAVAHRYVDTPHGVFPLRFFFTHRLPGDPTGLLAPSAVRQRMREVVDAEDPERPLTDDEIARALARVGVPIARRTVAKYRGLLRIGPSPTRQSLGA